MENICKNCGNVVVEEYCGSCGSNNSLKRIDRNYIIQEFLNLFGFEKGFLYTSKELLLRPGKLIREYLLENRQKVTKPITYLVLTSLLYTLVFHFFDTSKVFSEVYKKMYGTSSLGSINAWIQENMGYANLLLIFPIAVWTKIFFKKHQYNFYEIFVAISFIMGFGMLMFLFQPIFDSQFPSKILISSNISLLVAVLYTSWAVGQFYGNTAKNYFKAFLSYLFGLVTFQFAIIAIAIVYDHLIKS